jgi:type III secretory pathway component EscR
VSKQAWFLKIVSVALTLALMALLALGPFLHAHYGNSRLTGFHVDGISQVVSHTDAPFSALIPHATSSSEEESAALGVTASHARQTVEAAQASQDDPNTVAACLAFVLAVFAVSRLTRAYGRHSWRYAQERPHIFAAGMPPLAHAPPLYFM